MTIRKGSDIIAGCSKKFSRNIGEIVTSSMPLEDAGLHLLDGSVILGSGIYADFVTYIAGLVNTYPNLFTTEANWQTSVTNYGVCGKFVYDSVNNTVRLPKITGFTEGTLSSTSLGDLTEAGLPNITGNTTLRSSSRSADGAFYVSSAAGSAYAGTGGGTESLFGYSLDASHSSSIYGNSSTVQPQSIKVLYYIVIATSTKTDIEVDIDDIVTDLNNKLDKTDLKPVECVIEIYHNETDWYRIWSDGWIEQGGQTNQTAETITLHKEMADTNYSVSVTCKRGTAPVSGEGDTCGYASSTTQIYTNSGATGYGVYWEVKGYINTGE